MSHPIEYYKQKYEPVFGEWEIVREIGEGSFGKVFEIRRVDFGITYTAALKAITIPKSDMELRSILDSGFTRESAQTYLRGIVDDVVREFAIMSSLKGHTNIVGYENHKVYTHEDGMGWDILIQMELLTPLNTYLKDNPVTEETAVKLGCDICRALELCKKRSIIHRDIKPENIFVNADGDFKLGDFGIARQIERTQSGLTKTGTLTYMAPEVYKGEKYGASVDIYSLGIVIYRILNYNRAPFLPPFPENVTHTEMDEALKRRLDGESFPPPSFPISQKLYNIILKACAFLPADRFESPTQMREALLDIGNDSVPPVIPPTVTMPANETAEVPKEASSCTDDDTGIMSTMSEEFGTDSGLQKPEKKKNPAKIIIPLLIAVLPVIIALFAFNKCESGSESRSTDSGNKASSLDWVLHENQNENSAGETDDDIKNSGADNNDSGSNGDDNGENKTPDENTKSEECKHKSVTPSEGEKEYTSTLEWTMQIDYICDDCGETTDTKTESGKDVCNHPEIETLYSDKSYTSEINWARYSTKKCKVCGEVLEDKTEYGQDNCEHPETELVYSDKAYTSEINWYRFSSEKCKICGTSVKDDTEYGQDECKHEVTNMSYSEKNYTNSVKWYRYTTLRCAVCSQALKDDIEYGQDDCTHPKTKQVKEKKNYITDLKWTQTVKQICTECDAVMGTEQLSGEDKCKHTRTTKSYGEKKYSDTFNWSRTVTEKCNTCGAAAKTYTETGNDECTHPTTKEITDTDKSYSDALSWARNVYTMCTVCGKQTGVRVEYGKDECSHASTTKTYGSKTYSTVFDWSRTVAIQCTTCGKTITSSTETGKDPGDPGNIKVGSTIKFGSYEQDNNSGNGKEAIEWRVLEVKNNQALLISEYALDCKPYHNAYADITWENCSLRKWLNGNFYNAAFSQAEKASIVTSYVSADNNPNYGTNPGNSTNDKIFLLSINEANKYFSSDQAKKCKATAYTAAKGVYTHNNYCWWWLRTPGDCQNYAAGVLYVGGIDPNGYSVNSVDCAVRPAIRVKIG